MGNSRGSEELDAFLGRAWRMAFVAAGLDTDFDLPDWAFPAIAFGLPWVLFAGGLIGMNPLILVTLAGGLSSRLWPEAAGLGLAIAMVAGWGLTIAGTPEDCIKSIHNLFDAGTTSIVLCPMPTSDIDVQIKRFSETVLPHI